MKLQSKIKKQLFLALLVALASALHLTEAMIPNPLPIPGLKLGLANSVTLLTLLLFGLKASLAVACLRVLLGSLLGSGFIGPAFAISLAAALSSTVCMYSVLRFPAVFSPISASIVGAVSHNITQLLVVSLLIDTFNLYYYLPFLLLGAIPMGIFTGYIVQLVNKRLRDLHDRKSLFSL